MSVRRLHPVQPGAFDFTRENLAWAKDLLKNYPARKQASAVIPILWRAQEQSGGWITRAAIEYVAKLLEMSFIRVYEIATFYTMFQLGPVGRKAHVQVCGTTPCMLRGADDLINVCRRRINGEAHGLSADGNFSWEEVECLGACVNAPMVQIWKDTYEDLTPEILERILDDYAAGREVKPGPQNGRQQSAPLGALTSLTDPMLYSGERRFERMEMPPPAPKQAASAAPEPTKKPELQQAREAAAITKAPPIPADAEPEKRAAAETQRTTPTGIAGAPPARTIARARKAAERQDTQKETSPASRAAPKKQPPKKDPL
jgi:NADH-quinone oxidoreductase subunit E